MEQNQYSKIIDSSGNDGTSCVDDTVALHRLERHWRERNVPSRACGRRRGEWAPSCEITDNGSHLDVTIEEEVVPRLPQMMWVGVTKAVMAVEPLMSWTI